MGWPKSLKRQAGRAAQSPTGRSGRRGTAPARRLLRLTSPTGVFASTPAASGWPLRSEGLAQNTTSDSDPASPTQVRRNLAHRSSPTGTLRADWSHSTGDAHSVGTRRRAEKGKARLTSQNHYIRDHSLHETVLCSHPNTNSIVGANISLYSIVGAAKTPIQ